MTYRIRSSWPWLTFALAAMLMSGCGQRDDTLLSPDLASPSRATAAAPDDRQIHSRPGPINSIGGGGNGIWEDQDAEAVAGELVVRLAPNEDLEEFNTAWQTSTIEMAGTYARLQLPAGAQAGEMAASMTNSAACDVAEPLWIAETPESRQGTIPFYEADREFPDVVDQDAMLRLRVNEAHAVATGAGVIVAVLDTGIDATHPALAVSVMAGGWDFVGNDADPSEERPGVDADGDGLVDEAAGHGTHVAGIVLAVAPDALILPIRVLDSEGLGTSMGVARGIEHAVAAGAAVVNLSLGMNTAAAVISDAIDDAVDAGVTVVTSAGNSGTRDQTHFPSRLHEVISVAATDPSDDRAPFSSYATSVDLGAPGVGILSTWLEHGYASWSGTSMATPMVSGAAALWLELSPMTSPSDLRHELEETTAPFPFPEESYYEDLMGSGRLDAAEFVFHDDD